MVLMELLDRFLLPKTANSVEEIKNVKLSDSLRGNILVFKLIGNWLPEKGSKWFVIYAVYAAFMFITFQVMYDLSLFVKFCLIFDDLEQAAASIYIALACVIVTIKAYYLLKNRLEIEEIVKSLDREIFMPKTVKQFELVADVLRFSQAVYIFFVTWAMVTIILWTISPVLDSSAKKLPFSGWFPWDWTKTPFYGLCYAYQTFGIILMGLLNVSVDMAASGLMSNVGAQLDLLGYKLENIYDETESRLKTTSKLAIVEPEDVYEAMCESLNECIVHHQNILDLADSIGDVFNYTVFYEFVIVAAASCMTLFQLTMTRPFSVEFFSLFSFQLCLNMDFATFCVFGNEMILKAMSQRLLYAAFSTRWEDCSVKFRKILVFFMLRLSKPIRVRAAGYFVLSLETFTMILRKSWSYFAVLRQVHNR